MTASLLLTLTHIWQLVSLGTCLQSRAKISAYQSSKPDIRTFQMVVPQHVQEAMISEDGPSITDGGTRIVDGETLAGCRVISRSLQWKD